MLSGVCNARGKDVYLIRQSIRGRMNRCDGPFLPGAETGLQATVSAILCACGTETVSGPWILMCTLFLALFLGLCKRRSEITTLGNEAELTRENLGEYSISLIDNMASIVISMTLTAYSVYTFFSQSDTYTMLLTVPIVIYGIFRYQYLVFRKNEGGSPEDTLLKDKPLILTIGLWGLVILFAIYL